MEMYMCGETPNGFYFGAVVQALAHAGDVSNASRWLDEAVKVQADVSTACFGCVLTVCARTGDVEAAERWLDEAAKRGVASAANYTSVAKAWMKAGALGRADAVRCKQKQADPRRRRDGHHIAIADSKASDGATFALNELVA